MGEDERISLLSKLEKREWLNPDVDFSLSFLQLEGFSLSTLSSYIDLIIVALMFLSNLSHFNLVVTLV